MKVFFFTIFIFLSLCINVHSADIDGDIDDSSIDEYHEMGRIKRNTSFIVLNSLRRASLNVAKKTVIDKKRRNAAVSWVIVEYGSMVEGDIIIVDRSIGDKISVSK